MPIARLLIEVTAGVLPPEVRMLEGPTPLHVQVDPEMWQRSRPEPEHTKVFPLTEDQWAAADTVEARRKLLHDVADQALEYAEDLMCRPDRFNHVRVDWVWL